MLQLENLTPFAADIALFPNEHGIETLYVIVKAGFYIGDKWTLLEEQAPPTEADIYYGEPETTSLKLASDFHIGKPSTDIIMNGLACAKDRKDVTHLDVSLRVASLAKTIRVFGDRHWINGRISKPKPFSAMPMVYENAFGGVHTVDDEVDSAEQRNPVGKGFIGRRAQSEIDGITLPNLEDPAHLIQAPSDTPAPVCFGFISPSWEPRVNFVGTYDEQWQSNRAPYLPLDFDRRFFNMAQADMVCADYLKGGEPVSIIGMNPSGELRFHLPKVSMSTTIYVGDKKYQPQLNLETVLLEPNKLHLSMVWRAVYPCDKAALKISNVKITLKR